MTRNGHAVINTLCNPVSTDVQCMHYCDTAALHKYSALVCSRSDHNGQSVQFDYYPANARRSPWKSADVWCLYNPIARARVDSWLLHSASASTRLRGQKIQSETTLRELIAREKWKFQMREFSHKGTDEWLALNLIEYYSAIKV